LKIRKTVTHCVCKNGVIIEVTLFLTTHSAIQKFVGELYNDFGTQQPIKKVSGTIG
jgi:hypothetical protein